MYRGTQKLRGRFCDVWTTDVNHRTSSRVDNYTAAFFFSLPSAPVPSAPVRITVDGTAHYSNGTTWPIAHVYDIVAFTTEFDSSALATLPTGLCEGAPFANQSRISFASGSVSTPSRRAAAWLTMLCASARACVRSRWRRRPPFSRPRRRCRCSSRRSWRLASTQPASPSRAMWSAGSAAPRVRAPDVAVPGAAVVR